MGAEALEVPESVQMRASNEGERKLIFPQVLGPEPAGSSSPASFTLESGTIVFHLASGSILGKRKHGPSDLKGKKGDENNG